MCLEEGDASGPFVLLQDRKEGPQPAVHGLCAAALPAACSLDAPSHLELQLHGHGQHQDLVQLLASGQGGREGRATDLPGGSRESMVGSLLESEEDHSDLMISPLCSADSFVNSQEWTLSRSVPELKVVSTCDSCFGYPWFSGVFQIPKKNTCFHVAKWKCRETSALLGGERIWSCHCAVRIINGLGWKGR